MIRENAALNAIEQVLDIKLERQFCCGKYRIDGYDPVSKVAYEIHEVSHKWTVEYDKKREEEIKSILGCEFKIITV